MRSTAVRQSRTTRRSSPVEPKPSPSMGTTRQMKTCVVGHRAVQAGREDHVPMSADSRDWIKRRARIAERAAAART